MNCSDGRVCKIYVEWLESGLCYQFLNCPLWPCQFEDCTKEIVENPGYCVLSKCYFEPQPIIPAIKNSLLATYIIVAFVLSLALAFMTTFIWKIWKKRRTSSPVNDYPLSRIRTDHREYFAILSESDSSSEDYSENTPIIRRNSRSNRTTENLGTVSGPF